MMKSPLVTIGCAIYNGEETLARALTAVVEQDYPNLEILISDDCSVDGSPAICEEFARRDSRIRYIRNAKNIGLIHNCNLLAREASGEYFSWADQDDIKDRTFVTKAVTRLEADPDAVMCHSRTGVFIGDPTDIKYVIKLDSVDNVESPALRYANFLRHFTDTAIYGLIRTAALRETGLLRADLAPANALLFELLLKGKFVQIPEVLYLYSGRGVRKRPDPKQEYARANPGKKMPPFYFPFLVLARNQTRDIRRSSLRSVEKIEIAAMLWAHTSVIAMTKLVWRSLAGSVGGDRIPEAFTTFCDDIVDPKDHLVFLNDSDLDQELFPKAWYLKGGA
jgi:glycosyltransferase involved in cell wall biosynthesis